MKTGILSMQRIKNSGSFLQAYALKSMLTQLGNQVEFVDFSEKPQDDNPTSFLLLHAAKKALTELYMRLFHPKRAAALSAMAAQNAMYDDTLFPQLGMTEKYNLSPVLDALIIGSDEVFNTTQYCEASLPCPMSLYGKGNRAKKVFSYAASFGTTTMEKLQKYGIAEETAQLLKNFSEISVRDDNSAEIVNQLTGTKPHLHLDPALIYDFHDVQIKKPAVDNYIIVYAYFNRITADEISYIKSFAKKHGKKLICISNIQYFCDDFIVCHPLELLSYFTYADYVITDTFHGAVLSMKCHKRFAAYVRESNKQKLGHLIHFFDMDNRVITADNTLEYILDCEIDYTDFEKKLAGERESTYNYLAAITK